MSDVPAPEHGSLVLRRLCASGNHCDCWSCLHCAVDLHHRRHSRQRRCCHGFLPLCREGVDQAAVWEGLRTVSPCQCLSAPSPFLPSLFPDSGASLLAMDIDDNQTWAIKGSIFQAWTGFGSTWINDSAFLFLPVTCTILFSDSLATVHVRAFSAWSSFRIPLGEMPHTGLFWHLQPRDIHRVYLACMKNRGLAGMRRIDLSCLILSPIVVSSLACHLWHSLAPPWHQHQQCCQSTGEEE